MKVRMVSMPGPISLDPNFVLVWDSKTGSITLMLNRRHYALSNIYSIEVFVKKLLTVFTTASLKAD